MLTLYVLWPYFPYFWFLCPSTALFFKTLCSISRIPEIGTVVGFEEIILNDGSANMIL